MKATKPRFEEEGKFLNRQDAGRRLAERLSSFLFQDPIVLAIPKGGVPVALEVARALHAPLDVILVQSLFDPSNTQHQIGAMSESGAISINQDAIQDLGMELDELHKISEDAFHSLERHLTFFRPDHRLPSLRGKSVILVSDFEESGLNAMAALSRIQFEKPRCVTLAVPVISSSLAHEIDRKVDALVSVHTAKHLGSISDWYEDASELGDFDLIEILKNFENPRPPAGLCGETKCENIATTNVGPI